MFSRLSIPTPFQVGPVNAYLAGRTLVDPGPDSEAAWTALSTELENRGLEPGDLERVVVTHPHPDHFGMASRLRDAGASILARPETASIVGDFAERLDYEQSFFAELLQRHGMSASLVETVTELPEAFLPYAPDCQIDGVLSDGDVLSVDGAEIMVEAVSGHAPGELLLAYEIDGQSLAIVGDHVLGDVTPNPFVQPPAEPGGGRPHVLPAYNRSLERLREREFDQLLPGHGARIDEPTERIGEIRDANETRTDNVRALVDGQTTAMDVTEGLFDDLPALEYFPAMSEAIGHLDVLEERGTVAKREDDGRVLYERS